jgi:NOL1/NOP2/fmu family ribosome biogenesis protein
VNLTDDETKRFMAGETIELSERLNTETPPWCVARWQELPLGWLKIVGTIGKNHIPKPARLHLQSS